MVAVSNEKVDTIAFNDQPPLHDDVIDDITYRLLHSLLFLRCVPHNWPLSLVWNRLCSVSVARRWQ